ncbi:nucleotidyl transferase AbiEii/AbiGii toxin family protein [candidate division KSB1 bacterium]|nr:nucleotidyl transferase AbiEii/AbiGii toxin family protein [candidate division KSB1 bacterium]
MQIIQALARFKVEYVLVGGFAVVLYGLNRPTEDIDLFVKLLPKNIDNLKRALQSIYADNAINEIKTAELEEYAVIRYGTPDDFYIDVIARIGSAFSYEDVEYKELEIENVILKVATPEMLYRMKKDTLREKDQMDLFFLERLIRQKE